MEVSIIEISIKSEKKDVIKFLDELHEIITEEDFDIDSNLIIIKAKKDEIQYSTKYTLIDLNYDAYDVVKRLKELTIRDYSETLFDRDDDNPPLLFVFGKDINHRQIYIKLKIKGGKKKWVLCVSFHYAKWEMNFPYA